VIAALAALLVTERHAAGAVALPDTGLFAPVAEQLRERIARLASPAVAGGPPGERLELLLETGQPDEAARLARRIPAADRATLPARARVALAVQDFDVARGLVEALAGSPDAESRAIRYRWEFVRDDAARVDSLVHTRLEAPGGPEVPELLAAARLAYDQLDDDRADSLYSRALAAARAGEGAAAARARSDAHVGRALVQQRRRQWDASLAELRLALAGHASANALEALAQSLIRLGRTDDAIAAAEWAIRLHPHHEGAHYLLGNGYSRRNYTQLLAAYPGAFADAGGRRSLAAADAALAAGDRAGARAHTARLVAAHPGWADARVRLASLDFEDGRLAEARDGCFAALAACPEYGRAHAVLAKALESRRLLVDVHRPDYERRFAEAAAPDVPGIERFVVNWRALTPRHRKRVALSIAPWREFVPVLVEGGATFYIKPLHLRLGECPNLETLRDQRISYDSRLWDDVRGCGGYHTVTGIEDVERTIFDKYNTVLHELAHQVHMVLPAEDSRRILEHYRRAKARDDVTRKGFLSRYAGGSVHEYFAEGSNALESPRRDAYDPREVVRERLTAMDPELERLVASLHARRDVSGSYPVAYASGGDDRVGRGRVADGLPFYRKALALAPGEETALISLANALVLGGRAAEAESVAARAVALHPASGQAVIALAEARWHAGRGLARVRAELAAARGAVRPEDRPQVDQLLGAHAWRAGDAAASLAAYDSVLARQSDDPSGLHGRAAALALAGRSDSSFALYEQAVRSRSGIVDLRCDFAFDLLWAGRLAEAKRQLDEASLLDPEHPLAEALRGWAALERGDPKAARAHARQALAWGGWCDLARIVEGGVAARGGDRAAAERAWAPVRERIVSDSPPGYVFRNKLASWERVHVLPAVERRLLERFGER
jgi:tetratricopeptide (TPR) repeat protein